MKISERKAGNTIYVTLIAETDAEKSILSGLTGHFKWGSETSCTLPRFSCFCRDENYIGNKLEIKYNVF